MPDIKELTNDLDRKSGRRRFMITGVNEEERVIVELQWEYNRSLYDEAKNFAAVDHPPGNQAAADQLLDLVCALRQKLFSLDLT